MSNPDKPMLRMAEWWERVGRHFSGDRFGLSYLTWQEALRPAPSAVATAMTDRELLREQELRGLIRPYPTFPTHFVRANPVELESVTYMLYATHRDGAQTLHMCEAEDGGAFMVYRLAKTRPQARPANGNPDPSPITASTKGRP